VIRRPALAVGAAAAAIAALAMMVNVVQHGQDYLFRNDAEFFWVVARDPFGSGDLFRPVAAITGNAYRYGRPLYPVLAWLLALGRPSVVRTTMMVVELLSFGAMVALAAELVARRGRRPFDAMAVLLVPGVWWAVIIAISEPLVMALMLLVFVLHHDGRRGWALVAAAALLLTRETAVLALLPLAWADARRVGWVRAAAWLGAALVPLAAWWTWVRVRVGAWPFLDPSESRRGALDLPLRGYLRFRGDVTAGHVLAFALVAATVVAAIWVWRRRPWFPITDAALLFAVLLLFLGPNATRFPGEVLRLMMPAQVLVALAIIAGNTRSTDPRP
jgi:hypothetical protein